MKIIASGLAILRIVAKLSPHARRALRFVESIEKATRADSQGGQVITLAELVNAAREAGYIVTED